MRRILVFSDLHAERRALKEIIPVLDDVDLSIFCGDIVGYGKDIDYCIDFVLDHVDLVVLGNHDRLAITREDLGSQFPAVRDSILYTRERLSPLQKGRLAALPQEIWFDDIYVTHSIGDRYLREVEEMRGLFLRGNGKTKLFFFGHTHEPAVFKYNDKVIINPGSITKGRKGCPRSYSTVTNTEEVKFRHLEAII